jgi:hypothetical protein
MPFVPDQATRSAAGGRNAPHSRFDSMIAMTWILSKNFTANRLSVAVKGNYSGRHICHVGVPITVSSCLTTKPNFL